MGAGLAVEVVQVPDQRLESVAVDDDVGVHGNDIGRHPRSLDDAHLDGPVLGYVEWLVQIALADSLGQRRHIALFQLLNLEWDLTRLGKDLLGLAVLADANSCAQRFMPAHDERQQMYQSLPRGTGRQWHRATHHQWRPGL